MELSALEHCQSLVRARFALPTLDKAEKKAAEYLISNPGEAVGLTITEFASNSGASEATIVRFCRRLGYKGYPDFRKQLRSELKAVKPTPYSDVTLGDSAVEIYKKVSKVTVQTLESTLAIIDPEAMEKALEAISRARCITFFGAGDAGMVCQAIAYRFMRAGFLSLSYSDTDAQSISAAMLNEHDTAIAISHSGRTKTVINAVSTAKSSGATTIVLTSVPRSPLTKVADIVLHTISVDGLVEGEMLARRLADMCVLESLFTGVLLRHREMVAEGFERAERALELNKD